MPEFEDGLSTMTDPRDTEPVAAADAGKAEAPVSGERPDPLAEAQREAAEFKDKALRTLAEMENLRKRTEREVADARLYGNASFARDVLAVADNMQRALDAIEPELRNDAQMKSLIEGVELTERELLKVLGKHGVKKFSPDGEKFDPNVHRRCSRWSMPNCRPVTSRRSFRPATCSAIA